MSWHYLKSDCGPCTCLQDQGAACLQTCCSDTLPSALLRLTNTDAIPCSHGRGTGSCPDSEYGTTCKPSTASRGQRESILSRRDSRATTSVRREKRLASMDRNLPCLVKFVESQVRYDPDSCSWKTAGNLWEEDLQESSVDLPGWGMILDGVVWGPATSEPTTKGFGLGLFPTPMAGNEKWNGTFQEGGGSYNTWRETWLGVQWINPGLWEEIMSWPVGWTDSLPLDRGRIQQWLHSHGASCHNDLT